MYPVFKGLAEYNGKVNAAIGALLGRLSAEQYGARLEAYYPTIPSVMLHVMDSDAKWLGRFARFRADGFDSAALAEFKAACEHDAAFAFAGRGRLLSLRSELDGRLAALVGDLEGVDLSAAMTIDFLGKPLTRETWKFLLQMFNHQTHHRGQLSVFLDVLGIENDYSRVIDKIG